MAPGLTGLPELAAASAELVQLGDVDELVRHLDRLCAAEDWSGVAEVRTLSLAALERGRQLWPVATHAEYRLALEAPASLAASTLVADAGRFALGPLPEVAASTHTWEELAPHAPAGPTAAMAAHERVVRGDDLAGDDRIMPGVLDVPLALAPWEPGYPLAEYRPYDAAFPTPTLPALDVVEIDGRRPTRADDPDSEAALLDLVSVWTNESNGRAEARVVDGDAFDAIAAFGLRTARAARVSPGTAFAVMAWAGASGGAHGRRRGMAAGRFAAWWTGAALTDLLDEWPPAADEMGVALAELRWWIWDPGTPDSGWSCRLAVDDPADGLAWAITATDART